MNKRLIKASKLFLTGPTKEDPHLSSPLKDGVRSNVWNVVLVITLDNGVYPEYRSSSFHKKSYSICLNHLFKKSNSIFVLLLKSLKLVLINFTIVTSSNGTGLDLSLIDFIGLVRKRVEVKVVKLFVLELPDYESYI